MNEIMNTEKPKLKVKTPACVLPHVSGSFKVVAEDGEFVFPKLCPYCSGDLTYRPNGWEQDDEGLWMAESFDMECSNEPKRQKKRIEVQTINGKIQSTSIHYCKCLYPIF